MKLPTAVAVDDSRKDEIVFTIDMSPQLEAFCGHFPGNPILPGVTQIDWVVHFAIMYLGIKEPSAYDVRVKFLNIIRPNMVISLKLQIEHLKNRLSFTYQSGETVMSLGQLKLEAQI